MRLIELAKVTVKCKMAFDTDSKDSDYLMEFARFGRGYALVRNSWEEDGSSFVSDCFHGDPFTGENSCRPFASFVSLLLVCIKERVKAFDRNAMVGG